MLDFWSIEPRAGKLVLFWAIEFMLIFYTIEKESRTTKGLIPETEASSFTRQRTFLDDFKLFTNFKKRAWSLL